MTSSFHDDHKPNSHDPTALSPSTPLALEPLQTQFHWFFPHFVRSMSPALTNNNGCDAVVAVVVVVDTVVVVVSFGPTQCKNGDYFDENVGFFRHRLS